MKARSVSIFGIILLVLCFLKLSTLISVIPVHLDEGYNLLVPESLHHIGVYGTTSDDFKKVTPFNAKITTGPTVLLPIAAAFDVFGESLFIARVVTIAFLVFGAILFSIYFWKVSGTSALLYPCALFTLPNAPLFFVPVLGEAAEVACLVAALFLILSKDKKTLAGIVFGLGILAKYQIALFLPGIILECLIARNQKLESAPSVLRFLAGIVIPIAAAAAILFMYGGIDAYRAYGGFFSRYSGNAFIQSPAIWLSRITFLALWCPAIFASFILSIYFLCAAKVNRYFRLPYLAATPVILWWIICSQDGWARHLIPALMVIAPVLVALAVHILESGTRISSVLASGVLILMVFPLLRFFSFSASDVDYSTSFPNEVSSNKTFGSVSSWREGELMAADFLKRLPSDANVCVAGEFRDARFDILTGKNYCIYSPQLNMSGEPPDFVILSSFGALYGDATKAAGIEKYITSQSVAKVSNSQFTIFAQTKRAKDFLVR